MRGPGRGSWGADAYAVIEPIKRRSRSGIGCPCGPAAPVIDLSGSGFLHYASPGAAGGIVGPVPAPRSAARQEGQTTAPAAMDAPQEGHLPAVTGAPASP